MKNQEKVVQPFKVEIEVSHDRVLDMLTGALEGGSNYWYFIGPSSEKRICEATKDMEGEPFVDRFWKAIQLGVRINIFDIETRDKLGSITLESIAKGLQIMQSKHAEHFGNLISENDDAETADVFFQLAVMGELVYG